MIQVEYSPWARADLLSAATYYEDRSPTIASAFLEEVANAIDLISESPEIGMALSTGSRKFTLSRFPYVLIYKLEGEQAFILAVGHQRRHPDNWTKRK